MSLNFVASSVLQVADGVNDETEQQIENAETANMRRNAKSSGEWDRSKWYITVFF
jgi:hypothetical protein